MRDWLTRLGFIFLILGFVLGSNLAWATSVGKSVATKADVCAVTGKFTGTKSYHGKLLWIFERIGDAPAKACGAIASTFEVLIPSGSYSAISNSNVYPISITEPKTGSEIELHLESVKFKTGVHWLIAGDSDSIRVKR